MRREPFFNRFEVVVYDALTVSWVYLTDNETVMSTIISHWTEKVVRKTFIYPVRFWASYHAFMVTEVYINENGI